MGVDGAEELTASVLEAVPPGEEARLLQLGPQEDRAPSVPG